MLLTEDEAKKKICYTMEDMLSAYRAGVDYGLLIAEQERDGEDLFDAVCCYSYSEKMHVPSCPAPRRAPRSKEWREAMKNSTVQFIAAFCGLAGRVTQ